MKKHLLTWTAVLLTASAVRFGAAAPAMSSAPVAQCPHCGQPFCVEADLAGKRPLTGAEKFVVIALGSVVAVAVWYFAATGGMGQLVDKLGR